MDTTHPQVGGVRQLFGVPRARESGLSCLLAVSTHSTPKKGRDWKSPFLTEFAKTGNVKLACGSAGVDRSTPYAARKADAAFAAAWDEAAEDSSDLLEEEARRRAVEGTEKPLLYQGEVVQTVREYSDTLLIFLLKARRPERFRENLHVQGEFKPLEVRLSFDPHSSE